MLHQIKVERRETSPAERISCNATPEDANRETCGVALEEAWMEASAPPFQVIGHKRKAIAYLLST
jgi:hypothetical protein